MFNGEHYGVAFTFDEYYKTEDDTSFGGEVLYSHGWNDAGRFRLQVSLRERPTLPVVPRTMKAQAYFRYLEFDRFDVRSLETIEMIAEKVRRRVSACQGPRPLRPSPLRDDAVQRRSVASAGCVETLAGAGSVQSRCLLREAPGR